MSTGDPTEPGPEGTPNSSEERPTPASPYTRARLYLDAYKRAKAVYDSIPKFWRDSMQPESPKPIHGAVNVVLENVTVNATGTMQQRARFLFEASFRRLFKGLGKPLPVCVLDASETLPPVLELIGAFVGVVTLLIVAATGFMWLLPTVGWIALLCIVVIGLQWRATYLRKVERDRDRAARAIILMCMAFLVFGTAPVVLVVSHMRGTVAQQLSGTVGSDLPVTTSHAASSATLSPSPTISIPTLATLFMMESKPRDGFYIGGAVPVQIAKGPRPDTEIALIVWFNVSYDLANNVKFISFYVPLSDSSTVAIRALANDYKSVFQALDKYGHSKFKTDEPRSEVADTKASIFGGSVYVYHESLLGTTEQDDLVKYFRKKGATLILRGPDYLAYLYDRIKAGDATPFPAYSAPPKTTIDCSHLFGYSVLPAHSSTLLECRKPMEITIKP